MSRQKEILLEHAFIIGGKSQKVFDAVNGIIDNDFIDAFKKELLAEKIEYLASTLVDANKKYPNNDTMAIDFSTDFIVMRRKEFDELYSLV
jgi:hypothetical protein